jgi:hypothetical protein
VKEKSATGAGVAIDLARVHAPQYALRAPPEARGGAGN